MEVSITIIFVLLNITEVSWLPILINSLFQVFDSELNSSANVLKEYTQGSTKYLDVSTNADNLNLQVTVKNIFF